MQTTLLAITFLAASAVASPIPDNTIPLLPCPTAFPHGGHGPVCEPVSGSASNPKDAPADPRLGIKPTPVERNTEIMPCPTGWPAQFGHGPVCVPNKPTNTARDNEDSGITFTCPEDHWPAWFGHGPACISKGTTNNARDVEESPVLFTCPENKWPAWFGVGPACVPKSN